jgi:hypothetical protein
MATNRITAYLQAADDEQVVENVMQSDAPQSHNPLAPPAGFAPVPAGLLDGLSKEKLAWQQQLYRAAYQSALAAIALEAQRRARLN